MIFSNSNIPSLYSEGKRIINEDMKIVPFYIWVEEEKEATEEMTDKELELINQYKAKEAVEAVQNGGKTAGGGGDQYERGVPCHGDEYFHKFVSVIRLNPGQILRYCRDTSPLLIRPTSIDLDNLPCKHCGARTVFEFQLLPSLVGQMSVKGLEGVPVEFGTVLVFTCSQSCWQPDNPQPRSETVILQMESM